MLADFIKNESIEKALDEGLKKAADKGYVESLIEKARRAEGLSYEETAVLIQVEDQELLDKIKETAGEIKRTIYGNRIVMFAPLYVSNYCINQCVYCGYKATNKDMHRKKLTMEELADEVRILESMGHKRIALEAGEDPETNPIEYILECMKTIYSLHFDNGSIRRINVNIAATTVEDYKKLKEVGIGTYILFQETYHRHTYEKFHIRGPKANFDYHTTAMDRAMEAGIDDVGFGVLYGLYDYKFDTVAMMMHKEHLEEKFGVGPHTISVPRIKPADHVDPQKYPHVIPDEVFTKIVAVLRLAVPYTGIILSTREGGEFREDVIRLGVSQISAGSSTGVGGYMEEHGSDKKPAFDTNQFMVEDHRSPLEMLKTLCDTGYVPSFCTACYRQGRTGDRFMRLAKSGQINNVCLPNALMTLKEYLLDYGDDELREKGAAVIAKSLEDIKSPEVKAKVIEELEKIENGTRDLYL